MVKKSDYEKLFRGIREYSEVDLVRTVREYVQSLERIEKYLSGVPWMFMTPENRSKLRGLVDEYTEHLLDEAKNRIVELFRENTPRYRPAFERVLEYVLDHPQLYYEIEEARRVGDLYSIYRGIARELGLAFSTVRDAFTYIRASGVWD